MHTNSSKEKRKGRSQPASRLMSCLTAVILIVFLLIVLALLSRRTPPQPVTPTAVVVIPTSVRESPTPTVLVPSSVPPTLTPTNTPSLTPTDTASPTPLPTLTPTAIKQPLTGKILFTTRRSGTVPQGAPFSQLYASNADGSDMHPLTYQDGTNTSPVYGSRPSPSPDGTHVTYVAGIASISPINLLDIPTGKQMQLTATGSANWRPVWSPTGKELIYLSQSAGGNGLDIYRVNADGSGTIRLTAQGNNLAPDWSPDGKFIAFTRSGSLMIMGTDGAGQRAVTTMAYIGASSFSPDGSVLVFEGTTVKNNYTNLELFTVHLDGTGLTRITTEGFQAGSPQWSPDGSIILFLHYDTTVNWTSLYSVHSDGTGLKPLWPFSLSSASWSPDGKNVIFTTGDLKLYILDVDTLQPTVINTLRVDPFPVWVKATAS